MRIRTTLKGTVLGIVIGLCVLRTAIAQVTLPQVKVSTYYFWDEIHRDYWCDNQWIADYELSMTSWYYTPTFIEYSLWSDQNCTEGQPNEEWMDIVWQDTSSSGAGTRTWYDWDYNHVWTYHEEPYESGPYGVRSPGGWLRNLFNIQYTDGNSGHNVRHIHEEWETWEVHTGGTAGVQATNLIEFAVFQASGNISNVTLFGRAADRIDEAQQAFWYTLTPDHSVIQDATPQSPVNPFGVFFDVTKIQAQIFWNGTNISGFTNVIWVGEKMDLECRLSSVGWGWVSITNYLWQVDGKKIKDWVVSGTGTNATTAEVLAWAYDSNRTSAATQFIWVEPSSNLTVACTVQAAGKTLVAKTKFEVRRPEATWTLTPWSSGVIVASNRCLDGVPDPYYWLTTGKDCETNTIGMLFTYSLSDLKGYTGPYSMSFVQLVDVDWLANISEPPWGTAAPGGFYSSEKRTKGLDTQYPYKDFGQALQGVASDTPGSRLRRLTRFEWRTDKFESYLMWQSLRAPSIPVPLKVAYWDWHGKARRYDTNTFPLWGLVGTPTHPKGSVGTDTFSPPQWTNNVPYVPTQYNTYWFTEP